MDDQTSIVEIIYHFANGLDLKNWQMVRDCFTDTIITDYSDLRGEPPSYVSADDYVEKRRIALTPLKTQHLSSNHIVTINDDQASCHSQMLIYRHKDDLYFNTHCYYEHSLERTSSGWKISGIKQIVFWNEGDSAIHSGAK